jgi:hypothetical protein
MKQALPLLALDEERTETACMRLYHESNFPDEEGTDRKSTTAFAANTTEARFTTILRS